MPIVFTPPTYELKPNHAGPFLARFRFPYAYSVVKRGSSYEQMTNVPLELFTDPTVDMVYQGGHRYEVSSAEAALLNAAGYTTVLE